ncbi:MAG: alpha/beta hydrolase [Bacteroidota bacterium]
MLPRFIIWTLGVVSLLFVVLVITLHYVDFSIPDKRITTYFDRTPYPRKNLVFPFEDRQIHAVATGDTTKPIAIFVHGSPGSWDAFAELMSRPEVLTDVQTISLDRPGFGKSGAGNPERSLIKQAASVALLLDEYKDKKTILIGHSYGGPVVARMAIDFPDLVDGVILVAGSIDPNLEKTKWFQIPIHYKILSWVVPKPLYSSNEEIMALKTELEDMMPLWENITQPVSIIQGGKDRLVPAGNAEFGKSMLTNATVNMVELPDMDHFVPWSHPNLIIDQIKWQLQTLQ